MGADAPVPARRRSWWGAAFAMACVAAELAVARAPLDRPACITTLVALAAAAFGVVLYGSMGLRRERAGLRWIALGPILFSLALAVVTLLEANVRVRSVRE